MFGKSWKAQRKIEKSSNFVWKRWWMEFLSCCYEGKHFGGDENGAKRFQSEGVCKKLKSLEKGVIIIIINRVLGHHSNRRYCGRKRVWKRLTELKDRKKVLAVSTGGRKDR